MDVFFHQFAQCLEPGFHAVRRPGNADGGADFASEIPNGRGGAPDIRRVFPTVQGKPLMAAFLNFVNQGVALLGG
ncbi:hypothetical protein QQ054_34530 [Oscillatoria amoena NRMC-F 0135]|nr:hypothetical protein [Oscillatoria amoena NRMC-F 0135]